jgi:hypothetical protein
LLANGCHPELAAASEGSAFSFETRQKSDRSPK